MSNPFVKELLRSVLIGYAAAAAFLGLILAFDVAGLRGLAFRSDMGLLALFMLFYFSGLTFAGAQMAFRILAVAKGDFDEEEDGEGAPPSSPNAKTALLRPKGWSEVPRVPRAPRRPSGDLERAARPA